MIIKGVVLGIALVLATAGGLQADEPGAEEEEIIVMVEERVMPTTATITVDRWIVALGIGGSWGTGTVNYDGRNYRVRVSSVDILDAGFARTLDEGTISNIGDIRDISGTYQAVDAGLAAIGGAGGMKLMNASNDVEIGLWNVEMGIRAAVAPSIMWLSLE
jgi:hypothetical protein